MNYSTVHPLRSVAVPDKSQGAKMDQSINLFTQGPPTLYPFSLTPLTLSCQLGDKWLTGGIAGARGLTDRGVQRLTVNTDGSPSTSSTLMPLTFIRWRRGAG